MEAHVIAQERLGVLVMGSAFKGASGRGAELQHRHLKVFQVP